VRKLVIIICVLVVLAAGGYGALYFTNDIEPVEDILDNPQGYKDTTVKLMGKVERRATYGNEVVIFISDNGAVIPVSSQGDAPAKGKEVVVEGKVQPGLSMGDVSFGRGFPSPKL
jgi:cytochrome c-type biogenesis protein CcmE